MKQVKCSLSFGARVFFLTLLLNPAARAEPDAKRPSPPIEFVQARVLRNLTLQDFQLDGLIRSVKTSYPIRLRTRDHVMVYEFLDQPLQLRVTLDPVATAVERRAKAEQSWTPVTGAERLKPILDTDVTPEDLCLDFIRWEQVTALGSDSIKTLPAWAFEAVPGASSLYAKVRYWISSQFYAFLRVDAYNTQGQVIKRVEINGVQRIGDSYVIKEMQISTMIPGRDLSSSRTYIEVRTGKPGSGL